MFKLLQEKVLSEEDVVLVVDVAKVKRYSRVDLLIPQWKTSSYSMSYFFETDNRFRDLTNRELLSEL